MNTPGDIVINMGEVIRETIDKCIHGIPPLYSKLPCVLTISPRCTVETKYIHETLGMKHNLNP